MANRIKGITVEIGGDTTKLQTALKGVNGQIKNTQSAEKANIIATIFNKTDLACQFSSFPFLRHVALSLDSFWFPLQQLPQRS